MGVVVIGTELNGDTVGVKTRWPLMEYTDLIVGIMVGEESIDSRKL